MEAATVLGPGRSALRPLFIEDDTLLSRVLVRQLSTLGVDVTAVHGSMAGLLALENDECDAVPVDMQLLATHRGAVFPRRPAVLRLGLCRLIYSAMPVPESSYAGEPMVKPCTADDMVDVPLVT